MKEGDEECFNPRVREGRDPALSAIPSPTFHVSIHASVKDATDAEELEEHGHQGFNPRVREGRDAAGPLLSPIVMFQSTRP